MSRTIVIDEYTYSSIIDRAINREKHPNCNDNSSREGDYNFTQTESFEEAVDFAINGWDLGLQQYAIEDGVIVGGSTDLLPSLAGCFPHIQNHIQGLPEQMYSLFDNREYNLPTLSIYVSLAYSGFVEGSDALEFGKSLVAFINKKASTHNIRLIGVFSSKQNKNVDAYQFVTLKDYDSALVINNIAFAFHPSFFRRLWFSILEGEEYWSSGYGSTVSNYEQQIKLRPEFKDASETICFKRLNDIRKFKWNESDLSDVTVNLQM